MKRLLLTAALATVLLPAATLTVYPVADGYAVNKGMIGPFDTISVNETTARTGKFFNDEYRAAFEFPLPTILSSVTITSAPLQISSKATSSSPPTDFQGRIRTYASDGVITLADFTVGELLSSFPASAGIDVDVSNSTPRSSTRRTSSSSGPAWSSSARPRSPNPRHGS
ncbi:MAG: hypothetical protein SFV54_25185 [Bryobacteraceae bacterium]|nr:hypothetical protein [Bryobacteraceae bacterium]